MKNQQKIDEVEAALDGKRNVKQLISEYLGEDLDNTNSLVDDLGIDSLDAVQLLILIEEEYNIEIPDEDAEKIITVQDAINYVRSKR